MSAHTKGPWSRDTSWDGTVRITDSRDARVALALGGDRESDLANAQLIAAAPDLLASLMVAVETLAHSDFACSVDKGCVPGCKLGIARAAIAKARGGE